MAVFLGLDCGGSSCRAIAINSSGAILHQGQAGSANLANTAPGRLQNHLYRATENSPAPDFVCGCFAGLLTSDDRARAEDILSRTFPTAKVRSEPDYFAALMASENADLCVVAGTGSVVCSLIDGKLHKSGGRGYLLGDPGSAFQYGRASMLHFLEVGKEGISEVLAQVLVQRFGSLEENEVLAKLYRGGLPAAQLAKFASPFSKDVKAGQSYAIEALETQTNALVSVVRSHVDQFHPPRPDMLVCLAGGLWDGSSVFRNAFESKLRHSLSERAISVVRIAKPPVYGAVELAKELAN